MLSGKWLLSFSRGKGSERICLLLKATKFTCNLFFTLCALLLGLNDHVIIVKEILLCDFDGWAKLKFVQLSFYDYGNLEKSSK